MGDVDVAVFARAAAPAVISWLHQNYERTTDHAVVSRSDVYEHFKQDCATKNMPPVSQPILGKLVHQVFPGIATRRLGTRKNARYCYIGLRRKLYNVPTTSMLEMISPTAAEILDQPPIKRRRVSPSMPLYRWPRIQPPPFTPDPNHPFQYEPVFQKLVAILRFHQVHVATLIADMKADELVATNKHLWFTIFPAFNEYFSHPDFFGSVESFGMQVFGSFAQQLLPDPFDERLPASALQQMRAFLLRIKSAIAHTMEVELAMPPQVVETTRRVREVGFLAQFIPRLSLAQMAVQWRALFDGSDSESVGYSSSGRGRRTESVLHEMQSLWTRHLDIGMVATQFVTSASVEHERRLSTLDILPLLKEFGHRLSNPILATSPREWAAWVEQHLLRSSEAPSSDTVLLTAGEWQQLCSAVLSELVLCAKEASDADYTAELDGRQRGCGKPADSLQLLWLLMARYACFKEPIENKKLSRVAQHYGENKSICNSASAEPVSSPVLPLEPLTESPQTPQGYPEIPQSPTFFELPAELPGEENMVRHGEGTIEEPFIAPLDGGAVLYTDATRAFDEDVFMEPIGGEFEN